MKKLICPNDKTSSNEQGRWHALQSKLVSGDFEPAEIYVHMILRSGECKPVCCKNNFSIAM